MKKLLLVFMSFTFLHAVMAQKNAWSSHTDLGRITTDKAVARLSFPQEFKLFNLDIATLRQDLFSVAGNTSRHSTVISLPNADGQIEQFELFEASNFEPALQARFPEIRSFSGKGITDKYATLKLSYSPQGVQTMVLRVDREAEFIEPYSQDHNVYAVFKSQRTPGRLPWSCSTVDQKLAVGINEEVGNAGIIARSGGNLKTMRLAQSVTAEYSNYFGATSSAQVSLVLAAINATLTRCNGVYEKDLALHLNLVAASTNVIYYNASTDPYSAAATGSGGAWNAELQSTLTSVIGDANYDIGHLFGASGGGGNAGCIGCVCTNGSKGSGYTSPADGIPQGDNFDIDYVVHEVGHQLGANHTFSMSNEGTGVNKEPGSGITIMGYAGITSQDLAPHSIAFYHQASIAQIQANLNTKTCPVTTTLSNATPVVAAVSNYTIPKSTPFALTGSATDADAGDVLTYSWEQNDNSTTTGANSVASATKTTGPNWISFAPATSPTRYFPKLATILAGALISGPLSGGDAGANTEALSSVARTLNFRLTVRDNAPYSSTAPVSVGQTQFTDMVVTVNSASGPFAVSAPNTAVSYAGNSTQTITWSVASTTAAPVSCANVKISLSTDGGQTFPTVLAASTPNDGTEALVIPNTPTTTARIKIEAVGNIFFDISNTNFTITAGSACGTATALASSSVTTTSANVSWAAVSGATSYAVDYKLNTSATWTSFSTAQTGTTASLTGLASGSLYDWRVTATCTSGVGAAATAQFTTQTVCVAPAGLSSTPGSTTAAVSWAAVTAATSYAVEYKLNTSATWTSFSTAQTGTSANLTGLVASSLYDWRVSATCPSGTTSATAAQFTTTAPAVCNVPTGLTSIPASTTATVSWTTVSGAVSYAVEYKLNTSATWTSFSTAQTGTSPSLTGFVSSSLYDCRVTTDCLSGSSAAPAAQFSTTAPPVCNAPTGLASSAITSSGATVSWTAVSGAVSYAVDYKLNASATWTSFSTAQTGTSASLTGLVASSLYDWRVTTNCASGSSTATAAQFTTTAASACGTAFEPNETLATAAAITSGVTNSAAITTATDIDYFKITTTGTNNIVYNLVGPSGVDFDMTIYNSAGTQIGSGAGSTATETVSLTSQAAGTYYIKVFGYSGANSATCYTIKATATAVSTSCASTYDNSTNGTATGAAQIPLNTNVTGLLSPSGDNDYYKFVITTGGTITLTLTTLPADYDLRLYSSNGTTQVGISQNGSTTSETINYTAAAGTYYARVYGYNNANNATSCYTLKVATGTATKPGADVPVYSSKKLLTVYPNPVQDKLNINLTGYEGVAEIRLFDVNGRQVAAQRTAQVNSQMDISKLAKGIYLVKVYTASGEVLNIKVVKQ
ncbi:MAG: fibronectin type III domain-containing protein [Chitinophagaceae bacterium]|nr:fibronectin type III domain-containing protein [Chitinophagaceae bacterium]